MVAVVDGCECVLGGIVEFLTRWRKGGRGGRSGGGWVSVLGGIAEFLTDCGAR